MMRNWKTKVLTTALILSVLAPTASFAANSESTSENFYPARKIGAVHQRFAGEQQDKILDLVNKYAPESLDEWENVLAERKELLSELRDNRGERAQISSETQEQVKAIHESVKNGDITREEAREQLQELGINEFAPRPKAQLPNEMKDEVKAIHESLKNGDITREEAREQLQELGINKFAPAPFSELQKAIEANDESQIQDLLSELLEQFKERNQELSARL